MTLKQQLQKIKLFMLDVDGVLTNGGLFIGPNGLELMQFNVTDGAAIVLGQKMGFKFALLTSSASPIVAARAKILKIEDVYQNLIFKIDAYEDLLKKYKLTDEAICYIGDDLYDIPVLSRAGFSVVPSSAVKDVQKYADYITKRGGGAGAVREVIDMVLDATGKKKELIHKFLTKTLSTTKLP